MARILAVSLGLALLPATALNAARGHERPAAETRKIESLIKHVEDLKDAKFIRNGKEYDAKAAAKFLRGKWETDGAAIRTAKDFVEKTASVSSTTGRPYLIRLKGGEEVNSGDYLLAELKKLEKSPEGKRDP